MRKRKNLTRKRRTRSRKSIKRLRGGQAPLKVAMIFVGRIKGYEHVKDNLIRIKDKYKPTVFCSLNKTNKTDYVKGFCELMDVTDDRLHLEKSPPYPDYMNHVTVSNSLKGKWGDGDAKQYAYSNFYHIQKAWNLLEKHNTKFDIILYYRADIDSKDDLTLAYPAKDSTVYVPQNTPQCDHEGLCMIFLYGNSNTMNKFCNIIDYIEDMCKNQGITYNAERLFKKHMENNNIAVERFPTAFTLTPARHEPNPNANSD